MIKLTDEIYNDLIEKFEGRAEEAGWKGKAYVKNQTEFFIGAIAVIDTINGGDQSCIPPHIWVSMLRGDKLVKRVNP